MTTTSEITNAQGLFAEILAQVRAGDEVVLTDRLQPFARLVPMPQRTSGPPTHLRIRTFKGYRVLGLAVSHSKLAEELFDRE